MSRAERNRTGRHPNADVSGIKDKPLAKKVRMFLSEVIHITDTSEFPVYNPYPNNPEFRYNPILAFSATQGNKEGDIYVYVKNWEKTIGSVRFSSAADFHSDDIQEFQKNIRDIFLRQKEADEKFAQDLEKSKITDEARRARV